MNTRPILEPPHSLLAARELLADLQERPELAPYVMPQVWRGAGDQNEIETRSSTRGACVAVGLGETTLPRAGEKTQGGLVRVGVAIYVFSPLRKGLATATAEELREQVWLTVLRTANSWYYTTPGGVKVKALLTSASEIDLSTLWPKFAEKVSADALMIEIPLQLSTPKHTKQ